MCLGDWRLGKFLRSESNAFSSTATPAVLRPDQCRVGVQIAVTALSASGGAIEITHGGVQLAFLGPSNSGLWLATLPTYGDIVQKEITATPVGGNTMVWGVTEWWLPEDVLRQAIESLRSEYRL